MRCACSVLSFVLALGTVLVRVATKRLEVGIEVIASGHEHSNGNLAIFEKSSESIKITVKCLVFAVPLEIKGDFAFDLIKLVRVRRNSLFIDHELGCKLFLFPSKWAEDIRERLRYLALATTGSFNLGLGKLKCK